jgi:formate dehydrogenase beta subunit
MAAVIFGSWEKQSIDNRKTPFFEIEERDEHRIFDQFDPGNPIKTFIGAKGFLVFQKEVNILSAFINHLHRAARESCGKCTPCRVGLQILAKKIQSLRTSEGDLQEIARLAEHIQNTSLCGLGQSAPAALLEVIRLFPEELLAQKSQEEKNDQLCHRTLYRGMSCKGGCS